jgi:hypothetical protein
MILIKEYEVDKDIKQMWKESKGIVKKLNRTYDIVGIRLRPMETSTKLSVEVIENEGND